MKLAMKTPAFVVLTALSLTQVATAQTASLYTFHGDQVLDELGHSISGAGDVNADGYADLVVGAYRYDPAGCVRVYSGRDGALLHQFLGDATHELLGYEVSGAGDVNNDGFDDVIVGASHNSGGGSAARLARVYSGTDGSLLHEFQGSIYYPGYTASVSGLGDVNGDGNDDVIVGYMNDPGGGHSGGAVRVYSGLGGSVLYEIFGPTHARLGVAVSEAGDLNADGVPDFLAGDARNIILGEPNKVWAYSGADGSVLHSWTAAGLGSGYGRAIGAAGDTNNDGHDDVIVGDYMHKSGTTTTGLASVYSGLDGSVLHTFLGDAALDYLGYSVDGMGDADGDGYDDLLVGVPSFMVSNWTTARVYSGATGSILYELQGDTSEDGFGYDVARVGDVNLDGILDVFVGAPFDGFYGNLPGRAYVISLGTHASNYCTSTVNSSNLPGRIFSDGLGSVAANDFVLHADQLAYSQFGLFFYSTSETQVAFGNGFRCIGNPVFRLSPVTGTSGGNASRELDLTALSGAGAITAGSTWKFQFWFRDPAAGGAGFNLTDGLSVDFIP